ncbi:hypothetical protein AA313_de0205754 [Arthrobotrys entomopaga]|nr:hypothetical protein AA313_de0205754 [Arthrobotrys entomopaga]
MVILLSSTASAWIQINFITGREDWFDKRPVQTHLRANFKNPTECHVRHYVKNGIHQKDMLTVDAISIWNLFSVDGKPDIRAVGLYGDIACGATGGKFTTTGLRKIPYMVIVLDPKKMNGINIINFKAVGLNPTFGSWKPINVAEESNAGGFLESLPESDLEDTVLIFQDEENQGWQPRTGSVTHVDPGAWEFLRENTHLQFYLREVTERVLQPQWSDNEEIRNVTIELGKVMLRRVWREKRIDLREEGKSFLDKPFKSIEEAAPFQVRPSVSLPRSSPKFHPVVNVRRYRPKTGPMNQEMEGLPGLLAPLVPGEPNPIDTSVAPLTMEVTPSLEEIESQKIAEEGIFDQLGGSTENKSWLHAIQPQRDRLASVYRFSANLYRQYLNNGDPSLIEALNSGEHDKEPKNEGTSLNNPNSLMEEEREPAIAYQSFKDDEKLGGFPINLNYAIEDPTFQSVPIIGELNFDTLNFGIETALPLSFERARDLYLGKSDEDIINKWRNTFKLLPPYVNLPALGRPSAPPVAYRPPGIDRLSGDLNGFEEIEAAYNSQRSSRDPRQSLPRIE